MLRDAVATLSSGTPPLPPSATQHDPSQHEERLASSERLPTFSSERTPALDSVASSVTFDSQRRKRRRFFAPRRAASDSYNPYPSHATSSPIIRRHSNNPQPYFAHETRPETRASRRASLGSAASGTGLNEFDLLHGELLESDPEDHDEPLPPGNHRDLF